MIRAVPIGGEGILYSGEATMIDDGSDGIHPPRSPPIL